MPEAGIFNVKIRAKILMIKVLVGERGFEPPTPWSRNSWSRLSHFLTAVLAGALTVSDLVILAQFADLWANWSPHWSPALSECIGDNVLIDGRTPGRCRRISRSGSLFVSYVAD